MNNFKYYLFRSEQGPSIVTASNALEARRLWSGDSAVELFHILYELPPLGAEPGVLDLEKHQIR